MPLELLDEAVLLRGLVTKFYREVYGIESSMHIEFGRTEGSLSPALGPEICRCTCLCCYPVSFHFDFPSRYKPEGTTGEFKEIHGLHDLKGEVGSKPYFLVESSFVNKEASPGSADREKWESRVVVLGRPLQFACQRLLQAVKEGIREASQLPPLEPMNCCMRLRREKKESARHRLDETSSSLCGTIDFLKAGKDLVETEIQKKWKKDLAREFHQWLRKEGIHGTRNRGKSRLDYVETVERYNRLGNNAISEEFNRTWRNKLNIPAVGRFLCELPGSHEGRLRVLDAGCGPGHYLNVFRSFGFECHGLDISEQMVKIAREFSGATIAGNNDVPSATIRNGSIFDLHYRKESFDGIWHNAVLVHVPRRLLFSHLSRLGRILRNDGVLFISALIGYGSDLRREGRVFFYYRELELRKSFHKAGFRIATKWNDSISLSATHGQRKKFWVYYLLKKSLIS